ncbi:MAG: ROK family protein [Novosphingobium sp.]
MMAHYGLIEAGGTKFVLGIADVAGSISASQRIPTTTPAETLGKAIAWFKAQGLDPAAIGVGSFGPLDLDPASPTWGHIAATPKPHWAGADMVGPFRDAFGCLVGLDTDVNGAALAEARWGAGKAGDSLLYLTIGTGIGGGYVAQGRLLRGATHPEMGHMRVPRHSQDAGFSGVCPFHGDCLEGLASGPAITARWGASLSDLGAGHPGALMIGWYLAQAVVTFMAVLQPARIVLGGGVMNTPELIEHVRREAVTSAAGYFAGDPHQMIVAPGLGERSGLLGALALALEAEIIAS